MGTVIRTPGAPGENEGPQRLPIGTYDFRVTEWKQGTSSNKNPQLEVSLEVDGGTYTGRKVKTWLTMTENAQWRIQQFLEACGIEYWEDRGDTAFDADNLEGSEFRADIVHHEYNGKLQMKVENFEALYEDSEDVDETADAPANTNEEDASADPEPQPSGRRRRRQPSA